MGKTTSPDASTLLNALKRSQLVGHQVLERAGDLLRQGQEPLVVAKSLISGGHISSWQARQLLKGVHALCLGNYKLRELLSKSGARCTFLAEHEKLARMVCLTMLTGEASEQPALVSSFLKDARSAASLDHRNLAHVYDVDQDGNRLFVVTERIEGSSLADLAGEGAPLGDLEAARLIRQAAAGLEHAHEHGVVHGNLHPGNVIVDNDGVLKVMDFGFQSVSVTEDAAQGFVSPAERDKTAGDMYALGALLHFALTGAAPHNGEISPRLDGELGKVVKVLCQAKTRPDAKRIVTHLTKWIDKQNAANAAVIDNPVQVSVDVASPASTATAPTEIPVVLDNAKAQTTPEVGGIEIAVAGKPTAATGFAISAEPRKPGAKAKSKAKPKKQASTTTASPAVQAEATENQPTAVAAKSGPSTGLLIGIGVAVVLVLVGAGVGAMYLFNGDTQVAEADPSDTTGKDGKGAGDAPAKADNADLLEANPLEANPLEANPLEANPVEANPVEANPTVTGANPSGVPPVGAGDTTPVSSQKPAVDGQGDPPTPNGNSSTDSNNPDKGPKVDPSSPPGNPSVDTPPDANPKTPPTKSPPTKGPPKTPPKTPPKKGPPQKAPPNPFATFPNHVDLPAIGQSKGLGQILLDPKQLCFIKLRGGDGTLPKSKVSFKVSSGTDPRAWPIVMKKPDESSLVVAKLTHANNALTFTWTDEAAQVKELAIGLKNSMLSVSVAGSGSHLCALRAPVKAAPFGLKLEGPSSQRWAANTLPESRRVALHIEKIEGVENFVLDPAGPMVIDKGVATIKIGAGSEMQLLHISLNTATKGGGIEMKATPTLVIQGLKPRRLNPKGLSKAVKDFEQEGKRAQFTLAQLTQVKKLSGGKRDAGLDQRLSLAQQYLDKLKGLVADLKKLEQMAGAEGGLKMHIRLSASAGLSEFDLLHAGNVTPADTAKKTPADTAKKTPADKPAKKK